MRHRLHRVLKDEGRAVSYTDLASKLLKTEELSESAAKAILEPFLRSNPHFTQDAEGNWSAAEPLLRERFLPDVRFAVVDIETTGGRPPQHRITDLAAVRVADGEVEDKFQSLVNPGRLIPWSVVRLTGITDEMVSGRPPLIETFPSFLEFIEGSVFVAHCANFDFQFIHYFAREFLERELDPPILCTFKLAQRLLPDLGRYNLGELAAQMGIIETDRHRALGDAQTTAQLLLRFLRMLQALGLETLEDVLDYQEMPQKEAPSLAEGLSIDPAVLNDLPAERGVFRLLDGRGESVYSGKAPDIKRAVRDLFYPKNRSAAKFSLKLKSVKRVEARRLESELGMNLEANRMMRSAKLMNGGAPAGAFGFLKIGLTSKLPRAYAVKRFAVDGGAYYGPFRKQAQLRELVDIIHAAFPLRRQSRAEEEKAGKSGGKPHSPPLPDLSPALYGDLIERLQAMLEGRIGRGAERGLVRFLERAWGDLGPPAGMLRRHLGRLRHFLKTHSLSGPSVERRNLIIVEPGESRSRRVCYLVRRGLLAGELEFARSAPQVEELKARVRSVFLEEEEPPVELGKEALEEACVIAAWMRRELMDGFILDLSDGAEEERVMEVFLASLKDPQAAGTIISL
ncbi:MAG: exonuclease domain-containing protein [bacterium]